MSLFAAVAGSHAKLQILISGTVACRKSDLQNAKFNNAVVSGSVFEGANLTGTIFEDVLIGYQDAINL